MKNSRTTNRSVRNAMRLIVAAVWAPAILSCGFPQFSYLEPPVLGTVTPLPPEVRFVSQPNDSDVFRGYEIYYKFYSAAGESQFAGDRSSIESAGPGAVLPALDQRGYRRAYAENTDIRPAIEIPVDEREDTFEITVQFQFTDDADKHATVTWATIAGDPPTIVRDQSLLNTFGSGLGFRAADLVPGAHPDLPQESELTGDQIGMAVAVLAYGIDFEIFAPIYSTATVAGELLRMTIQ